MHQPCYVNLNTETINTPTPMFRTLFNYYPMVFLAKKYPGVKMNFNLTPVLIRQILGISSGEFRDSFLSLLEEKNDPPPEQLLGFIEELPAQVLKRHKIIGILREKIEKNSYSAQDIFDLKMYLHLACFHPVIIDGELERLLKKGRQFTENDMALLYGKEKEILAGVLNEYKSLQARGQIEISTSPLMHPIMPLLYTTDTARKTKTSFSIPEGIFSYPEDAKEQLTKGMETYKDLFGRPPAGIWPSEGSLSTEVLELFADSGILWTATDEYLLAETLSRPLSANEHYSIWKFRDKVSLFFRDHHISDLIGFAYQQMGERDAALEFTGKLRSMSAGNQDRLVTIILDGENPWDFYPDCGKNFLPYVYEILSESGEVKTVTFSDALNANIRREKLDTISPGSWMGANFDNWIGKDPANKAWEILGRARKRADEKKNSLHGKQLEELGKTIMLAESSDWFWWYSLPADRKIKVRFDARFRSIIRRIYELLGDEIPEFLNLPVEEYVYEKIFPYIKPSIDGKITHFYEWHEAVKVDPFSLWATFKPADISITRIFYGYDENNLYVRIDYREKPDFEIQLSFSNSVNRTFTVRPGKHENEILTAATDEIVEISIPRREILPEGEKTLSFNVKITEKNGQEFVLPSGEYFKINFTEKEENWIV